LDVPAATSTSSERRLFPAEFPLSWISAPISVTASLLALVNLTFRTLPERIIPLMLLMFLEIIEQLLLGRVPLLILE
jgi:hypothetical protein